MVYTSREKVLDMIRGLRENSSKCNESTPAFMRDATHHLENALTNKDVTKEEYELLYEDLISIGEMFYNSCKCVKSTKRS